LTSEPRDVCYLVRSDGTWRIAALQRPWVLRFWCFAACFAAPPHCLPRGSGQGIVIFESRLVKGRSNVRFGSKADICSATRHVRFTPNSDRESEIPHKVVSALPSKADMCGATREVR